MNDNRTPPSKFISERLVYSPVVEKTGINQPMVKAEPSYKYKIQQKTGVDME